MGTSATASSPFLRGGYAWLGVALALGALARFWALTRYYLSDDEAFTFLVAAKPVGEIWHFIGRYDFHPPLLYLVTHFLRSWLPTELDIRYLSAAAGLVTIAATWAITRRLWGEMAAAVAAVVVALDPGLVWSDRQWRMYALQVALATVSWWLVLVAEDADRRRAPWTWVGYGATALVLPYLHYLGALTLLAQGLYALTRFRRLWPVLPLGALAAVALIPWLWAIRHQFAQRAIFGFPAHLVGLVPLFTRVALAEGLPGAWRALPYFDVFFFVCACALVMAAAWMARRSMLPFWVLPPIVEFIASYATHRVLFAARFLYVTIPAFAASVGVVVGALARTRARAIAWAVVGAVLVFAAVGTRNILFERFYQQPDWFAVDELLQQTERADDVIVFVTGSTYWVVHDFAGFRGHVMIPPTLRSDVAPAIAWIDRYPMRRVWYIAHVIEFTDPAKLIHSHLLCTRRQLGKWSERRASWENRVAIELYGPEVRLNRRCIP